MVKEAGKLEVWGTVVSIFEMTQNWDYLFGDFLAFPSYKETNNVSI